MALARQYNRFGCPQWLIAKQTRFQMYSRNFIINIRIIVLAAFALTLGLSVISADSHQKEVTFSKDVAPILYKGCAECHRPNDIAPFSVLTYWDVRPWARSIREKIITRDMPPWHADPRYGDFANDARLSQQQIDTIVAWADSGAKEGDPADLPLPPDFVDGWNIGKPDRVFSMAEDYIIKPRSEDNYVYFVIQTKFTEDKWIQAAEIRPGNKRVVHHAIAHVLTPQSIAKSKEGGKQGDESNEPSIFYKEGTLSRVRTDVPVIDDGASDSNGGAFFRRVTGEDGADEFSLLLASYAPGKQPDVYPAGMAKRVPAGSVIMLQIHYSSFRGAFDQPERDRTSVGLIFAKEPAKERVMTLTVQNHFFRIPPGAANHEVTASYTFDRDVKLINYMPHMHLRGKDMKYEIIYPGGRRETLLWVPKFNFNWQTLYLLKEPVAVPRGAKILITAHFDNSSKNKYNPDATKAVRWGDPTYDEMMIGWMDYVARGSDNSNVEVKTDRD